MSNPKAAVLVVEDEAMIRLAAMDLFVSAGYEAVEAKTGVPQKLPPGNLVTHECLLDAP